MMDVEFKFTMFAVLFTALRGFPSNLGAVCEIAVTEMAWAAMGSVRVPVRVLVDPKGGWFG